MRFVSSTPAASFTRFAPSMPPASSEHRPAGRPGDSHAGQQPGAGRGPAGRGPGQSRSRSDDPGQRAALIAVLQNYGEPEPIEISDADLDGLRRAAIPPAEPASE